MGRGDYSPTQGVKRLGSETESSAEVKNKWSYTSTAPVCLNGMHKDSFSTTSTDKSLNFAAITHRYVANTMEAEEVM
jgi:hypothetical protein